jgi:integrase
MENSRLREAAPTSVNVTVGKRSREYLTHREVERLIEAAKQNRSGHRDATAILVAYRHGLRASELVALRWDDIDLATGRLHVRRVKSGDASLHPISARESRARAGHAGVDCVASLWIWITCDRYGTSRSLQCPDCTGAVSILPPLGMH